MLNCKKCNMVHDGKYGSGKFCSVNCARSFSACVNREERNKKVSLKLRGRPSPRKGIPLSTEVIEKISISLKENYKTTPNKRKFPNELVFVENSNMGRHHVKQRLIDQSLIKYECFECGLGSEWNGKILSLQLDHKNGIGNDNRLDNLRFLCPNCHTQQETYAAKNIVFKKKNNTVKH